MRVTRLLAAVLPLWLAIPGCASLIGIEDVRQDPVGGSQEGGSVSNPDAGTTAEGSIGMGGACTKGQKAPCREDGMGKPVAGWNDALDGQGICHLGEKTCGDDGTWGACAGAVGPKARDCDSADDGNCDGIPDNTIDATCQCNAAHPTGACTGANNCPGTRACGSDHKLAMACDAPASCDCNPNDTGMCTGGPSNCPGGMQTCGSDRKWSLCMGAPAHCDCKAGETRLCTAVDGAWPCGTAPCLNGQWDATACTPATQWCQDLDGDGACSSVCVTQCTGPANTKKNCPPADCNDTSPTIKPSTPESCTAPTSCVAQAYVYSATAAKCECTSTGTAANEGAACGNLSVCMSGVCTCNSGADCQIGCQSGNVSCILGPACKTTGPSPAGYSCGTASVCNGGGVCYTNCTLGTPKCNIASCVAGSVTMSCTEGSVCNITWASVGAACEGSGHCQADHTCMH